MSYILNALRKSEQERQLRQSETLENRLLEKHDTAQKKNSAWLIILAIINVFLLIFFFWPSTKEDINEGVARKSLVAEKSEIKDENKGKISLAKTVNPTVKPVIKKQISIAEQLKVKPVSYNNKEKAEQLKSNLARNDKKEKPEPEQQKLQRVERKKEAVTTTVLVEEPVLEMVTENINNELERENSPPFFSELDYEFRRRVPEIDINVFVYSEIKEQRFIMINMKKYLSGQQIAEGMKLKEIRMNSLVVEYKNRVFQIKRN